MLKLRWVRALLGLDQLCPKKDTAEADWLRERAERDESQARHLASVAATLLGPSHGIGVPGLRTPAEADRFREGVEMAARLLNEARIHVAQRRRGVVVREAGE